MTAYGVDEDWQRLTPAQLRAAGKTFVVGYVSEDTTGKNITRAEVDAYLAAGVAVLLVYEYSATAVEGGAARGARDAGIAIAAARALGYPRGCAIAFAVDEDETAHPSNVDAYARAFTAACHAAGYRSMVYGGLATVRRCADLGLVDLLWQTYAWSGTPTAWDPRAAIRQTRNGAVIDGKAVDLDTAMVADYGAWIEGAAEMELGTPVPTTFTPDVPQRNVEQVLGDLWYGVHRDMHALFADISAKVDALKDQVAAIESQSGVTLSEADRAAIVAALAAAVPSAAADADELAKRLGNG